MKNKKTNLNRNQGASAEPNVSAGTMNAGRATEHKQMNRKRDRKKKYGRPIDIE